MGTPTANKSRFFIGSKQLASDGDALTEYVADSGTVSTLVDAALTQADEFWKGAIIFFSGDTTTTALRGIFAHVEDFIASTDTVLFTKDLPAPVVSGDTYKLFIGGNWRSDTESMGLKMDGSLPELFSVVGTNITGLTITKASPSLGVGTLSVFYDSTLEELFIKMDANDYGIGIDVSGDVSGGVVLDLLEAGWIQFDTVAASLPVGDETDTFTLAKPKGTMIPDVEGSEAAGSGKLRYHFEVIKNTDGADTMVGLEVWSAKPTGTDTTIATAESLGVIAGDFATDDASDWPTKNFWVKNTTVNAGAGDCRYVNVRSGNRLYCAAADWAVMNFDTGSDEIFIGDTLVGASSLSEGIVQSVIVTSGTWGGNDAAGVIILSETTGAFSAAENLQVSAATMAVSDGVSVAGMRGYTATTWTAADDVEVMTDMDIGVEAPTADQFDSPATEQMPPDGVSFADHPIADDSAVIGDLTSGSFYGVWKRLWIVADQRARDDVALSIHARWS